MTMLATVSMSCSTYYSQVRYKDEASGPSGRYMHYITTAKPLMARRDT